jgi:hypothetical protein
LRALIELDRDRLPTALAEIDRAVAAAAEAGNSLVVAPSVCTRATVLVSAGRTADAVEDFERLLAMGDPFAGAPISLPMFAWLAVDLGRVEDAERVVERSPARTWAEVARAILAGDAATAGDLLGEIGQRPAEAYARLRAGGEHLSRALEFYRSVGATRYLRAEARSSFAGQE